MKSKTKSLFLITLLVAFITAFVGLAYVNASKTTAFAQTQVSSEIDTEAELATALAAGGDVIVGGDIEVTAEIAVPAGVTATLDLNGYAITTSYQAGSITRHEYALRNKGVLTIKDTVGTGSISARGIYNGVDGEDNTGVKLTLNNVKVVNVDYSGGACVWSYGGEVIINGCNFIGYTACVSSKGYLEINGGTYTCYSGIGDDGTFIGSPTYNIRAYNGLKITDGTFTSRHGVISIGGGTAVIDGGSYTIEFYAATTSNVVYVYGDAEVTINGGKFLSDDSNGVADSGAAVLVSGSDVTAVIKDGTFSGMNGMVSGNDNNATITIEGGNYSTVFDSNGYGSIDDYVANDTLITVNGAAQYKDENGEIGDSFVAKVGDSEYATFDLALAAAKAMTGEVTVEIYGKVTLNESLAGSYDTIKFVGKTDVAEIYLDVQGYITATGKKVTFDDLTLSKSEGGFITNAGFMNVAFGVYDVNEVVYTNCLFDNGAYASSGKVTFKECTFEKSYEKYPLWAYGSEDITVDTCVFDDDRGIKIFDEGKGTKNNTVISVENSDFSSVTAKPAIVLTYGQSVNLKGNDYSDTGVFELDKDGKPNGTTVTFTDDDGEKLTCVNDDGACGVMVGNEIYTTVAQAAKVATAGDTVTLLHDTDEKATFIGVTFDANGYDAANVASVKGTITPCYTRADGFWGESKAGAKESFVIELYQDNVKIASASLNDVDDIIDGTVKNLTWSIPFAGSTDEYWTVEWAENYPKYDMNPDSVKLIVDGEEINSNVVAWNAPDDLNKIVALAEGFTGGVVAYTNLTDAMGKFNGRKVNVLRDVSEEITGFYGCTLSTNVEDGITITSTSEDWIDFDDVTIVKGVTVNSANIFSGDSTNVIEGVLNVTETYYHGYDAKTTVQNGGRISVTGSTILRYNEQSDAGLYIYGDGNDETIEFENSYYIGAYSGTFYAEDATIKTGYFLLKNSYDDSSYADIEMTLDNSSLTVVGTTDTQDSFIIDDQASLTLKNGSSIDDVRDFNILEGTNLTLDVDSTSSIKATNVTIADGVPFEYSANEDGTINLRKTLQQLIIDAQDGATIVLDNDYVLTESLTVSNKKITIDLNGKTIKFLGDNIFNNNSNVTFKNGTFDISGAVAKGDAIFCVGDYSTNATLTLEKVNVTGKDYSSAYAVFYVYNTSTLNIIGCEFSLENDKASAGGFIKAEQAADGKVNITNAKISLKDAKIGFLDGTVVMDGVELNIEGGKNAINQSALTVKNSSITIKNCDGRALTASNGDIIIENSTLDLSGATEGEIRFKAGIAITLDETSSINECNVYTDDVTNGANINGVKVIAYAKQSGSDMVGDFTVVKKEANQEISVTNPAYQAKVEYDGATTYYLDIDDAFAAVKTGKNGAVVTILEGSYTMDTTSVTLSDNVSIIGEGEVTINNQVSITANGILLKNVNVINNGGTALKISGNGTIEDCNLTGSNGTRWCYANNGDVVFKDCVITGSVYGIHFDGGKGDGNIIIENCTITGWTSFGSAVENISLDGTTFEEGNYNYIRFFQDATIDGCTFNPKMAIDVNDTTEAKVTVNNSTVTDGTNITELFEEVDKVSSEITVDEKKLDCVITTVAALNDFANRVNNGNTFDGKTIYLGSDIDLADIEWTAIGTTENPFKGNFDGQNYTISNLVIDKADSDYVGLFGYADGATIKNLTVENVMIVGRANVGGIAGAVKTGTIDNCHVAGMISISGNYKVGGIVGSSYAKITDCTVIGSTATTFSTTSTGNIIEAVYAETDLEGDNVGGIVGFRGEGDLLLSDCTVENVTISGTRKIGGIAGSAFQDNNIVNCSVNNVTIRTTATEEYAQDNAGSMAMGGIIGLTSNEYEGGSLSGASVENVTFANENGVTISAGALTGGHRGSSAPVQGSGMSISENNVDVNTVTGTTNTYLAPEFAVSTDGYWVINGVKTEYLAVVSVDHVENMGTENNVTTYRVHLTDGTYYDFTVTNGENGADGADGADGKDGVGIEKVEINDKGELVIYYTNGESDNLGVVVGADGEDGKDGVDGEDGKDGTNGKDGVDGEDGKSAYEIWLEQGNSGTEQDFLDWLKGDAGQQGAAGADGVGIERVEINDKGELVIYYTNGESANLGVVVGADGADGKDGVDGVNGKDGSNGAGETATASIVLSNAMLLVCILVVVWVSVKLRKKQ